MRHRFAEEIIESIEGRNAIYRIFILMKEDIGSKVVPILHCAKSC